AVALRADDRRRRRPLGLGPRQGARRIRRASLGLRARLRDGPRMRQVFLDTETTGLSPESGDRVIEIGCVELVNRRLTGRNLHFYLNPERRSHQDAIAVHGLP